MKFRLTAEFSVTTKPRIESEELESAVIECCQSILEYDEFQNEIYDAIAAYIDADNWDVDISVASVETQAS